MEKERGRAGSGSQPLTGELPRLSFVHVQPETGILSGG